MTTYKVLTIDGGGIRGIIPATVLRQIETEILHGRVDSAIDLFSGTSTGGIIALGLVHPKRIPAYDLVDMYQDNAATIFPKTGTGTSLFSPKYPNAGLINTLRGVFGDATMGQASRPVIVPTYDLALRRPGFFSSYASPGETFAAAGAATSSGETFFPSYGTLIDGGNIANNPSNVGLAAAVGRFGQDLRNIKLLSIGTGHPAAKSLVGLNNAGELQWASHISDVTIDGVAAVNHTTTALMLGKNYLRLDCSLPDANADMDNVDPKNMAYLEQAGLGLFAAYRREIEEFFNG